MKQIELLIRERPDFRDDDQFIKNGNFPNGFSSHKVSVELDEESLLCSLEKLFKLGQNGMGENIFGKIRSVSIGDVFKVDGKLFMVSSIGFKEILL